MARGWWLALLPALGCLACSSNGDALNPVKGTVTHKGQPARGVVVTFHPPDAKITTHRPVGTTGEDGTFTLTTGPKEGAPAGSYVVTFIWPEEAASKKISAEPITPRDRLKGAYSRPTRPGAPKIQIKEGTNQLEPFDLK